MGRTWFVCVEQERGGLRMVVWQGLAFGGGAHYKDG